MNHVKVAYLKRRYQKSIVRMNVSHKSMRPTKRGWYLYNTNSNSLTTYVASSTR